MKTKKANQNEVKDASLVILLTKEQKEAVAKEAEKMGLTQSTWARLVLIEKINNK
jgi:hypothetical protein